MRSSRIATSLAAVLAIASFGAAASIAPMRDSIPLQDVQRAMVPKRILPAARAAWVKRHQCGPGWSCRQVQRMARKRRNQKRNKRAHRG